MPCGFCSTFGQQFKGRNDSAGKPTDIRNKEHDCETCEGDDPSDVCSVIGCPRSIGYGFCPAPGVPVDDIVRGGSGRNSFCFFGERLCGGGFGCVCIAGAGEFCSVGH